MTDIIATALVTFRKITIPQIKIPRIEIVASLNFLAAIYSEALQVACFALPSMRDTPRVHEPGEGEEGRNPNW